MPPPLRKLALRVADSYGAAQMFVHEHHFYAPEGPREHGVVSAAEAATRWLQGAQAATGRWASGMQNTQKDIVGRAVAQQGVAIANYQQSINSGRWAAALNAVGNAGIKAAAQAKQANYGTGIAASEAKYQQKIGPVLAYIAAGLPQLESMPSGTTQAGVARATFWIQYMAGAKGL